MAFLVTAYLVDYAGHLAGVEEKFVDSLETIVGVVAWWIAHSEGIQTWATEQRSSLTKRDVRGVTAATLAVYFVAWVLIAALAGLLLYGLGYL